MPDQHKSRLHNAADRSSGVHASIGGTGGGVNWKPQVEVDDAEDAAHDRKEFLDLARRAVHAFEKVVLPAVRTLDAMTQLCDAARKGLPTQAEATPRALPPGDQRGNIRD